MPDINRCIRSSRGRLGFYAEILIIFWHNVRVSGSREGISYSRWPTYDVYASKPNVVSLKAMFKTLASEPKNCHAPIYRTNYENRKMLLDRGATIPIPPDVKCSCDDCVIGSTDDSLKFSLARINAYRLVPQDF